MPFRRSYSSSAAPPRGGSPQTNSWAHGAASATARYPTPLATSLPAGGGGGGGGVAAVRPSESGDDSPTTPAYGSTGHTAPRAQPTALPGGWAYSRGHPAVPPSSAGAGRVVAGGHSYSFTARGHPAEAAPAVAVAAPPPALQLVALSQAPLLIRPVASSAGGVVAPCATAPRPPLERPTVALASHIMVVYKVINSKFCHERRRSLLGSTYNSGFDDCEGYYIPIIGEEIARRYTVQEVLGKGSFGIVLRCCDEKYQEVVAVKVIRSGSYFHAQGCLEAEIVAYLNKNPALANLVVQLRKAFLWQGHIVLVFDLLSFNLFQLIRCTKFNGISLDLTRKFAFQLLQVLLQLEQHEPPIIHCDLKPENVVLRDRSRSGIRVIDFGSSCYQQHQGWELPPRTLTTHEDATTVSGGVESTVGRSGAGRLHAASVEASQPRLVETGEGGRLPAAAAAGTAPHVGNGNGNANASSAANSTSAMPKYIQSRFYRSPEVILELSYTTAIDRWSLACMLVELHTGVPLFPGKNEADMIALFTAILGPLPDAMVAASPKRHCFYQYNCPPPPSSAAHPETIATTAGARASSSTPPEPRLETVPANAPSTDQPAASHSTRRPASPGGAPHAHGAEGGGSVNVLAGPAPLFELRQKPDPHRCRLLEEVIGVNAGGPRGCRRGQPGHDPTTYAIFLDFIRRLLEYDPRRRMSCAEAIWHPFLAPLIELEAAAAASSSAAAREGGG